MEKLAGVYIVGSLEMEMYLEGLHRLFSLVSCPVLFRLWCADGGHGGHVADKRNER